MLDQLAQLWSKGISRMAKVTRIKVRVLRAGLELTAYGQSGRGTKFSQGQLLVPHEPGEHKPSIKDIGQAIDKLRQ